MLLPHPSPFHLRGGTTMSPSVFIMPHHFPQFPITFITLHQIPSFLIISSTLLHFHPLSYTHVSLFHNFHSFSSLFILKFVNSFTTFLNFHQFHDFSSSKRGTVEITVLVVLEKRRMLELRGQPHPNPPSWSKKMKQ